MPFPSESDVRPIPQDLRRSAAISAPSLNKLPLPSLNKNPSVNMLKILFRRGFSTSGGALAVTTGTYLYTTWDVQAVPISNSSDPIFRNKHYRKCNPNDNPTVHDLHILKVPFSQIEPALLENQERLVERYCGGVWGGFG